MNGWSVHSQQILGADAEDSTSPPPSGKFVFGNVNNSDVVDVDELVSFFTNAAAVVPPGLLIFCGKETSDNNYIGIYGEALGNAFRVSVDERISVSSLQMRSFHLDLVNSPTFSEKLKSFCLQAVNDRSRQNFLNSELHAFGAAHGFVLSEQNLGLPLNNANIDVTRCLFGQGSVKRNEQKFVVMTFSATSKLNRSIIDDDPYEFTSRINEFIRSMVVKSCEKFISAHVDALLSHISSCDRRFTTFHAALGQILHVWSDDVSSAVITRMDAWLSYFFSRDTPSRLPIPTYDSLLTLFMQAKIPSHAKHHTFCNPLTIAVSMTLAEHLQFDSLTKYISSDSFKSSLLALEQESLLIKETCAEERRDLDAKVQAITEMLNVMTQVLTSDARV